MRLVDADLLDEEVMYWFMCMTGNPKPTTVVNECRSSFRNMIDEQPTAYNVEAVVENVYEIGRRFCNSVKCNKECQDCDHGVLIKTIVSEIKNGGVK